MRRPFGIIMLLSLFMASTISGTAMSKNPGTNDSTASANPTRFVVFEAFMRSTCGICNAAAPNIDQLAQDYHGLPVVFLEYDVDNAPYSRKIRFWYSYSGTTVMLPMIVVDSGNQIDHGYTYFYYAYKWMVDDAWTRPAQADIKAGWRRDGDKIVIYATVKNLSGETLSSSGNSAAIHAIVYEDAHVKLTDHFVRKTVEKEISNLSPDETGAFTLETSNLSDVVWENLHVIVLVDYRPNGSSGAYDMLQAAEALQINTPFTALPNSFSFMIDPADTNIEPLSMNFLGLDSISWTAVQNGAWFSITPPSGTITTQPAISVDKNNLSAGWQQGSITFTSTDGLYSDQVTVSAFLGSVKRVYLPVSIK
ncbi:MAG: hypothetical protein JW908_03090 [Anaerolineales bacterium]|nr:hypothetical protein [Anaerolineales bacterium]